jgi:hypothetical protein
MPPLLNGADALMLQLIPAPVAFVVLAKPAPVYPALLESIVPSTPQKPVAFSWIVKLAPPPVELVEVDVLVLLEDELLEELLELEELEELLLDEELELLLDEELLELDELPVPPSPVQVGAAKLPSWVPCTPKALATVWPGAGNCQLQQLVN